MRKVFSAGNDDLTFASRNNVCASLSTLPIMGPEETFQDREGTAAAASSAAVTAALVRNSAMWNGRRYGGATIGMVGQAAVDAAIAEVGMGVSNPSCQRQLQAFQLGTSSSMPNSIPVVESLGNMNCPQNNTTHTGSNGDGARLGSDQPGGEPGFLCQACGTSKKCRPTVCCRKCQKLYHPMCAGYEPSKRKYPPPDWICPMCPGGQRGPNDKYVHPSLRGKGIVTIGSQPWCPVCFGDNRVPGRKKSLDGGQKCVGCGLKAHADCQRLRPDGTWPCVECHRRMQKVAPETSLTTRLRESAPSALMNRGWQRATMTSSVDNNSNEMQALAPVVAPVVPPSKSKRPDNGDLMMTPSRALGVAATWGSTPAGATKIKAVSSMESKSETVAHAGAPGAYKPAPAAVNALGSSNVHISRSVESQQTILQRKGTVNSTATDHRRTSAAPGTQKTVEAVSWRGDSRSFSKRTPVAEENSRRGPSSAVEAVRSSRRSESLKGSLVGASVVICKTCKKRGKLKSGKTCAGCRQWWHANADCSPSDRGKSDSSNLGKWIGGWRCQSCLNKWEDGLRFRTARVVEAWAAHEKRRYEKEKEFQAIKDAAIAESIKEKRHGFAMSTVEVPPIQHPPAGILPFLDEKSIRDTGFRLARITRDDCAFLGPEGVMAKVDICWEHRIFAVIGGVFDPQKQPLMDFLAERKGLSCRISGKAAAGESSSTMGDYRARLFDMRDGMDKPRKDSPGTFFLDTPSGQTNVLNWLPSDPLMTNLTPESPRGGLEAHIAGDRCKFGPFTFGGGRNFPLESLGLGGRQSHRQYMKGKGRDRIGGSTTHIDGMGSFTAIGGLKDGVKRVTGFETADCATALAVAKFKAFAKPGGSSYVVNDRIDDDPTLRRRLSAAGVRFATFPIRAGEAYLVPSGALHEFMNEVPCLSVAWNIMPHPANCVVAMNMAEASAREAEEALGANTDRSKSAIEHAPPEAMRERHAAFLIKRWLERGPLRLRMRRALVAGSGGGATVGTSRVRGGVNGLSPRKAVAKWAELAARHEVPSSIRKRYVCYWPNGDFYKESPPVFNRKFEAVRESAENKPDLLTEVFNKAFLDHAEGGSGAESEEVPDCKRQNERDLLSTSSPPTSAPPLAPSPSADVLSQSDPAAPVQPEAQPLSSGVILTDSWRSVSSVAPFSYVSPSLPLLLPPLRSAITWSTPTSYSWLPAPPSAPIDQSDTASGDDMENIDVGLDDAVGAELSSDGTRGALAAWSEPGMTSGRNGDADLPYGGVFKPSSWSPLDRGMVATCPHPKAAVNGYDRVGARTGGFTGDGSGSHSSGDMIRQEVVVVKSASAEDSARKDMACLRAFVEGSHDASVSGEPANGVSPPNQPSIDVETLPAVTSLEQSLAEDAESGRGEPQDERSLSPLVDVEASPDDMESGRGEPQDRGSLSPLVEVEASPDESSPDDMENGRGEPADEVDELQDWGSLSPLLEIETSPAEPLPEDAESGRGEPAGEVGELQDGGSLSPMVEVEITPVESSPEDTEGDRGKHAEEEDALQDGGSLSLIMEVEISADIEGGPSEPAGEVGEPQDGGPLSLIMEVETSPAEPLPEDAEGGRGEPAEEVGESQDGGSLSPMVEVEISPVESSPEDTEGGRGKHAEVENAPQDGGSLSLLMEVETSPAEPSPQDAEGGHGEPQDGGSLSPLVEVETSSAESSPGDAEGGRGEPAEEVGEPRDGGSLSPLVEVETSPAESSPGDAESSRGEPAEEGGGPQDGGSLSPLVEVETSPAESLLEDTEGGRGELQDGGSLSPLVEVETSPVESSPEGALLEEADNEPKEGGSPPPSLDVLLEEADFGRGDPIGGKPDLIIDEGADEPSSNVLESSPTADLSEDSSATAGGVAEFAVAGSVEASDASSSESQVRLRSSRADESAACDHPGGGSLCFANASSSEEEDRGVAVEVSGCKDVSSMPPPPTSMAQPEVESSRRGNAMARDDSSLRGLNDGDETGDGRGKLAEVVPKKPSPPAASKVDRPRPRYIHHSRSRSSSSRSNISGRSSSRSSSSYRSSSYDSDPGCSPSEGRQDARRSSEGRDRVNKASPRSSRRQRCRDSHEYDGGDRCAEKNARYRGDHDVARDREYRRSICRSRPADSAQRDRRRSGSSQCSGSRGEAYRDRDRGRHRREREDRREKRDRERERYRQKVGTKERQWCRSRRPRREPSHLPPRDRRGEIRDPPQNQRSRLPWREESGSRSKILAGDTNLYRRRQIRDRDRDKVDSYSSWRRSRSHEKDRSTRHDGRRRESSSVYKVSRDCRVGGHLTNSPLDDAKSHSTSALSPPPPVSHALMPPARGTLAWNPGEDTEERTGRGRRLARADAIHEKKERRRENGRGGSMKGRRGVRDDACDGANGGSGGVTAAAVGSGKGEDRASAVGDGRDRCLSDRKAVVMSGAKRQRSSSHLEKESEGDKERSGKSRRLVEGGDVCQGHPVASKARAEVSSFWNSRAAAAAAAEGTARSRPLSGVNVLVDRLRVGGGGFADVFTNPAALNIQASSSGSVASSSVKKGQAVVEGGRQGCITARSFDSKRSVLAGRFSKSGGWGKSRESRVGGPVNGEKANGLSASDVLPDGTCVSRKRHSSVLDSKDCCDGCSVSLGSGELSEAAISGMRKDINKRRRREYDK